MGIFLFFLLGGCISVLAGFFGVGGGFILTPMLMLIGFSPLEAIATSLLFTIGTSLSSIIAHIRMKSILWKEGMILGISGMAATQIAKPFVFFLESKGWDELAIPIFYIFLLAYFALKMLKQGKRNQAKVKVPPASTSIIKMILIGLFAGFISTTLGVGGGFIIVPLTITFLGIAPKEAVSSSMFAVLLIVVWGFMSYAFTISIDYKIGFVLVAGGLIGSQIGVRLIKYYENREISLLLGALYLATLVSVVMKLVDLSYIGLILLAVFAGIFFIRSLIKVRVKKRLGAENK
ncbi:sulfite exporter TauE/SafE family protein [Cytobacillus praedii]|uniref:sulfite exporter TauE/SafE family protein n=1 Tax=Cytobacillus praedii TaxID=1742358 RepID=UPI002E1E6861|nr:sulfite exporter TauE/SafE family protein [Cytobacillus praedii]